MSFIKRSHLRSLAAAANTMADRIGLTGEFTGYLGKNDGTNTIINTDFPLGQRMVWYYEKHGDQAMLVSSAILDKDCGIPFLNSADNKDLAVRLGRPAGSSQVHVLGPLFIEGLTKFSGQTPTERLIGAGGTVTSVGLSVPTGATVSGSPVTGSGTLALGWDITDGPFGHRADLMHDLARVTVGNALAIMHDANQNLATYAYQFAAANGDKFTHGCILAAGTYYMFIDGIVATSCGKVDITISDGASTVTVISGLDWYGTLAYNTRMTITSITLAHSGWHKITMTVNGKNGSSSGYELRFTRYGLYQTAD